MHINLRRFSHPKTMVGLGLLNIVAAVNWAIELWDKYDFLEGKSGLIAATLRAILNTEGGARGIFLVAFALLLLAFLFEIRRSAPETSEASNPSALANTERAQLEERPIPGAPIARRQMADPGITPHPQESAVTLQPPAKKAAKKEPSPNFVCTSTDPRPAHVRHDILVEGHRIGDSDYLTPNTNGAVLVVEISNEFTTSQEVGDVKGISAEIIYQPPEGRPIKVKRGSWLQHSAYQLSFYVNDSHSLIIAYVSQRTKEYVFILTREMNDAFDRFENRVALLEGDFYNIKVRLISEAERKLYKEFDFSLTISREPDFDIELVEVRELAPHEIRQQLEAFLREGSDLLRDFPRMGLTATDSAKVEDWEKRVVKFLGRCPDQFSATLFLADFPEVPVAGTAHSGNWIYLKKLARRLATLRQFIDELRRG